MDEFDARGFVMGIWERRDFMEEVRKITGVTAEHLGWMSEVLWTQEQDLGCPWWDFSDDEMEIVLTQLRASTN